MENSPVEDRLVIFKIFNKHTDIFSADDAEKVLVETGIIDKYRIFLKAGFNEKTAELLAVAFMRLPELTDEELADFRKHIREL